MGRPRSFDSAETRDAICSQFWDTGYADTSVDDLMAATGLSKGSLYGAFGSKHDMFVRALTDYTAAASAEFRDALAGDDAGALRRLRAYVRATAKSTEARRGCMLAKAIAELAGRDSDVDAIVAGFVKNTERTLVNCIRQAQRAGDVARDADARRLGLTLLAVLRGMESLGKAGAGTAVLRSIAEGALASLTAAA
jgi:AcrR family transcriptional regulator